MNQVIKQGVKRSSKKGSVPVLLVMLFASILLVLSVLTEDAASRAAERRVNSAMDLAGRSILSEYDRHLKEDYGLFGFLMDEKTAEKKLKWYLEEGAGTRGSGMEFYGIRCEEVRAGFSGYELTSAERLLPQILDYMKPRFVADGWNAATMVADPSRLEPFLNENGGKTDIEGGASTGAGGGAMPERELLNQAVLAALPTQTLKAAGVSGIGSLPGPVSASVLGCKAGETLSLNCYILKKFRNHLDPLAAKESFFRNEAEYVLFGNRSDRTNRLLTSGALVLLRTSTDLAHIYSNPKKQKLLAAAAAILTPGPEAAITQFLLATAWAAAEASNDVKRLFNGTRVPLVKTAEDWRISLSAVTEAAKKETGAAVKRKEPGGLNYEEYLFLLLCVQSDQTKVYRIMDLIQINMKLRYYDDFRMGNCYSGLTFACVMERENRFLFGRETRRKEFQASHVY